MAVLLLLHLSCIVGERALIVAVGDVFVYVVQGIIISDISHHLGFQLGFLLRVQTFLYLLTLISGFV